MSDLEIMLNKVLERYPAQSRLEVKVTHVKERPEYGDRVVSRKYVLTATYDTVESMTVVSILSEVET